MDLNALAGGGLITVTAVEAAAAATATAQIELPDPLPGEAGLPRIALIGAGLGRPRSSTSCAPRGPACRSRSRTTTPNAGRTR